MATNSSNSAYTHVAIRMGGLVVEIGTETSYPDMVSDITNRVLNTFQEAVATAKENGIDITNMRLITSEYGDDYEDE
jgi:hypothetical protein